MAAPSETSIREIQKAYVAFYGRPADYAGLMYWAQELDRKNGDLNAVIQSFGTSVESNSLYGGSSTEERIDKIYQQLFNRAPEAEGRAWWAAQIDAGTYTLQSAARYILGGASGDDLALIERKVDAAADFTEALRSKGMSHSYNGEGDIAPARTFLSQISTSLTSGQIDALVSETVGSIQNAAWASFSVASNMDMYNLASSNAQQVVNGSWIFADTGRLNYSAKNDIYLVELDTNTMQPGSMASLGNAGYGESAQGIASGKNGGHLVWGDLDNSWNSPVDNLAFAWSLDSSFKPLAAIHLGTGSGNAPGIEAGAILSSGKMVLVGEQNNVADARDAYVVILNSDMSVHAQRRFDSPTNNSSEKFSAIKELNDGSLLLISHTGEVFKVNQDLEVLATRDVGYAYTSFQELSNGLLLAQNGNSFKVLKSDLTVLSAFYVGGMDNAAPISESSYLGYDAAGEFFRLDIDLSDPLKPTISTSDYKLLASRSGYGVYVDRFSVEGDTVTAIDGANVFVFELDVDASPNLAADYRLMTDSKTAASPPSISVASSVSQAIPDWEAFDVQIVAVGTLPTYTEQTGLIQQTGLVAI